jgi:hypothetical protein
MTRLYLANPYHDEKGRFATAPSFVRRNKGKLIVGGVAGVAAASVAVYIAKKNGIDISLKDVVRDMRVDNTYYGPPEYKQNRNALGSIKGTIANPNEYITRKNGFGPKLARAGLDLGTDAALSYGLNLFLAPAAAHLATGAIGAVSLALFGAAAPSALLTIGGLVAGVGATVIVFQIADKYKTQGFHSYLNRVSPKDNEHIYFSGQKGKAAKVARAFDIINTGQVIIAQTVMAGVGFGPPGLSLETPEDESLQFSRMLYPFACNVAMDIKQSIVVPFKVDLSAFGFINAGGYSFMDKEGAKQFLYSWENKELPVVDDPIVWGNTEIKND